MTLIEAARTMLADSLLHSLFWAEAVDTACYVKNRVLVTKTQNKTPYELLNGRTPSIGFMRPFGCLVTILNILDSLEFEDLSNDNINEVNPIDSPVPAVGQISTNNTNTFSVAGPSNAAVSPHMENLHIWILLNFLMILIF
nr:ribonuclease H-like domain-containing protein [Tanacetum cinerariifolium]